MPAKLNKKNPNNVIFKKTFECEDSGADRLSFIIFIFKYWIYEITAQYFLMQ